MVVSLIIHKITQFSIVRAIMNNSGRQWMNFLLFNKSLFLSLALTANGDEDTESK